MDKSLVELALESIKQGNKAQDVTNLMNSLARAERGVPTGQSSVVEQVLDENNRTH